MDVGDSQQYTNQNLNHTKPNNEDCTGSLIVYGSCNQFQAILKLNWKLTSETRSKQTSTTVRRLRSRPKFELAAESYVALRNGL